MRRSETQQNGPNYTTTIAEMAVFRNGAAVTVLYPEKRFYPVQGMDSLLNYSPTLPQIGGGSVRSQADAILRGSK